MWRTWCSCAWSRRRTFLFVVSAGACLCFLPWIFDWSKFSDYDAVIVFLRKLSDGRETSGANPRTVSDKRASTRTTLFSTVKSDVQVDGSYTAYSNLTRMYTTLVSTSSLKSATGEKTWERRVKIVIGLAITSVGLSDITPGSVRGKFAFFRRLLPTFCKTASGGYHYEFYLAHDYNDTFFGQKDNVKRFKKVFHDVVEQICAGDLHAKLHLVECKYAGRPAWAQNDAMIEGYLDGGEYFYRLNDDTQIETPGWLQDYLNILQHYSPPNVGVVGPRHVGGNQDILTYDFVHRTHVDIFGFYYPRLFGDWFADNWITKVYEPGRTAKAKNVWLKHTQEYGQRYKATPLLEAQLKDQIAADRRTLNRFLLARESSIPSMLEGECNSKVIAMSLYGSLKTMTYGALRNAQLLPTIFPGWTLRIYICEKCDNRLRVPDKIVQSLQSLGSQIIYVSEEYSSKVAPRYWNFDVADDTAVDCFLIRKPEYRLHERDALVAKNWLQGTKPVMCIRDHVNHTSQPVVDGLWGGRPAMMRSLLEQSVSKMLINDGRDSDSDVLKTLWKQLGPHSVCYDSVSCSDWPNSVPFPAFSRTERHYLGQKFDEHHNPMRQTDRVTFNWECVRSDGSTL